MMRQQQRAVLHKKFMKRNSAGLRKKQVWPLMRREEARENLQEFEDTIGDGCLYTQSAGTVMMGRGKGGIRNFRKQYGTGLQQSGNGDGDSVGGPVGYRVRFHRRKCDGGNF